jgi:ornithine cyclodeaminase
MEAFEAVANQQTRLVEVLHAGGIRDEDSYAIKAAADARSNIVGFKVGSYWPGNRARNLRAHAATTTLLDPDTGYPMAMVNATFLNGYRTAAANAVATDLLAGREASTLAVIGAGHQAEQEIRALAAIRPLALIKVATRTEARGAWLLEQLADLQIEVELANVKEALGDAEIIVTVTPAREILVRREWVMPGAHISAMGADAPGKYELDPALVAGSRLFADCPRQSLRIGEFREARERGLLLSPDQVTAIGLVSQGKMPGRQENTEITIFDSSGLAAQDVLIASRVYELARARGLVTRCDF